LEAGVPIRLSPDGPALHRKLSGSVDNVSDLTVTIR
jgi:hypothetical protein